jgi:FKBP-type peptidyl-prolyl cis-trans isomerase
MQALALSCAMILHGVAGFTIFPAATRNSYHNKLATHHEMSPCEEEWIPLCDNGAVKKKILEEGSGDALAQPGSEVEVDYVGTLGEQDWSVEDVVECWLKNQQGLDAVAPAFLSSGVDGTMLMDSSVFTDEFVTNELGVSNKIQCKKLIMASKRLAKQQQDFPVGTEFDSSAERGPYKFTLGKGKAIRAYELCVPTMKYGERSLLLCRSDYAYGAEGFRRKTGEVIVPPFATLCFDIKLLKC